MKRPLVALFVFAAVSALLAAGYSAVAQTVANRIKAKGARVDAVPSIDVEGRFYFTSVRQYERDLRSIFAGVFADRKVRDARPVDGSLVPALPGHSMLNAKC